MKVAMARVYVVRYRQSPQRPRLGLGVGFQWSAQVASDVEDLQHRKHLRLATLCR